MTRYRTIEERQERESRWVRRYVIGVLVGVVIPALALIVWVGVARGDTSHLGKGEPTVVSVAYARKVFFEQEPEGAFKGCTRLSPTRLRCADAIKVVVQFRSVADETGAVTEEPVAFMWPSYFTLTPSGLRWPCEDGCTVASG